MKLVKYRIVRDTYSGYECQIWRFWFPFWTELGHENTHKTIYDAEEYIIEKHLKTTTIISAILAFCALIIGIISLIISIKHIIFLISNIIY